MPPKNPSEINKKKQIGMTTVRSFSQFLNEGAIAVDQASASQKAANFVSILQKYLGKKEEGNNRGDMVTGFLKKTGLGPGYPWCMAFVYSMFDELTGGTNPLPKTAGVVDHWRKVPTGVAKITRAQAIQDPTLVKPGQVFFKSRSGGGHTGIVLKVEGNEFVSIDGNSSDQVKLNRYKIDSTSTLGFADYFQSPEFSASLATAVEPIVASSAVSTGGGKEV